MVSEVTENGNFPFQSNDDDDDNKSYYVIKVKDRDVAQQQAADDDNGIMEDEFLHVNTAVLNIDEDYRTERKDSTGIVFSDLSYEVSQKKLICIKQPNKKILKNLNGMMGIGLNAIMGPTGSGKTSLMDILADRKGSNGISGTVLIDGRRQPRNFRFISGYVVQDDVVMGTLTVRENLYFSAALRLPNSMSWKNKKERVESVIEDLGLESCANTKIGNEFLRGVSGGERKRTNIGMELIIEPQVLFLDEPTTGLDANTAESVVSILRQLSHNKKRTIIMSIHQPRYSIYKLFDSLTLLSRGEMVYHGPSHATLHHFASLGYHCEEHDNPADFFLDVIIRCEKQLKESDTSDPLSIEQGVNLPKAFAESELGKTVKSTCASKVNETSGAKTFDSVNRCFKQSAYATNFFWEFFVIFIRSIANLLRNPLTSFVQLGFVSLLGLIVGILYFQLDTDENGYQNRIGVVFFLSMMMVFTNMSAVDLFIRQRVFFIHENASGYYRVSAYFFAKILSDILPLRLVPMIPFTLITYFMIGLQLEADKFFIYFLTLFLLTLCASSTVFFVSSGVGTVAVATLLIPLTFVTQMLFGGFLITRDAIPAWIRWLQYFSVFRYSVEALAVNEVDGLVFNERQFNETIPGRQLLLLQDFDPDWLFYDWIGLFGIMMIFLTLTYITLRSIKKEK